MKTMYFIVLLWGGIFNCFAQAEFSVPKENSLFTIYAPAFWDVDYYNEGASLEIISEDKMVFCNIEACGTNELDSAIAETKKFLKVEYDEIELGEQEIEEIDGIKFYIYTGLQMNYMNDLIQYETRLFQIDGNDFYLFTILGDPDCWSDYEWDIGEILYSVKKVER